MNLLPVLTLQPIAPAPDLRLLQPDPPLAEPDDWAEQHLGPAQLGDRRRNRRLVTYAASAAEHPSGSIPHQAGGDGSERRWLMEEWHKALKTGCQAEERRRESGERLQPLVGARGVVAVRLLRLRALARRQPQRLAEACVPVEYVRVRRRRRKAKAGVMGAVAKFFPAVAKPGGLSGRKRDGEPGGQAIWAGREKLRWVVRGARLARGEEKISVWLTS